MRRLSTLSVDSSLGVSEVVLYQGDLTQIPEEERVDLLVVSAFHEDYTETSTSLVGALARAGLHVGMLAYVKDVDLRGSYGCWLSKELKDLPEGLSFQRIMVFEPKGRAPDVVGDLFRALNTFVLGPPYIKSIALPILASGDQMVDPQVMIKALVKASLAWLQEGLPVSSIKIVERNQEKAELLARYMQELRPQLEVRSPIATHMEYDFFVSYSHRDTEAADALVNAMQMHAKDIRIFLDHSEIPLGVDWQQAVWDCLAKCHKAIALLSPDYLKSNMCKEEFGIAMLRHRESPEPLLIPILLRTIKDMPPHMRILNYADCTESNLEKLQRVGRQVVGQISLPHSH